LAEKSKKSSAAVRKKKFSTENQHELKGDSRLKNQNPKRLALGVSKIGFIGIGLSAIILVDK